MCCGLNGGLFICELNVGFVICVVVIYFEYLGIIIGDLFGVCLVFEFLVVFFVVEYIDEFGIERL